MSDTLELLETIGADASLRHAATADLLEALAQAQASAALMQAVSSGDGSCLSHNPGDTEPPPPPPPTQSPHYPPGTDDEEAAEPPPSEVRG